MTQSLLSLRLEANKKQTEKERKKIREGAANRAHSEVMMILAGELCDIPNDPNRGRIKITHASLYVSTSYVPYR